jgi:hypothetical protein
MLFLAIQLTVPWRKSPEAKSLVPDWGDKVDSRIWLIKVDSGIGLPMVNVLESTLAST